MAVNNNHDNYEEEILDIHDNGISKDDLFKYKIRRKDRKIRNSDSYNNNAIIYVVSMVALFVIWFTAFAQPIAYNNKILALNNGKKKDEYFPSNNQSNSQQKTDNSSGKRPWKVAQADNQRWNVGFTNMMMSGKVGGASEVSAPSFTSSRASFHVSLAEPGDEITYNLVIKNSGTIDAKVSSIIVNPVSSADDPILYNISDIDVGDELDAGKETMMSVNIKYNPEYTGHQGKVTEELLVLINYVQK